MNRVSVITGGAGGMGLATAKIVGRDHTVVLCDVRQDRLTTAAATLQELGITPTIVNCDVTDRRAVADLLGTATNLGSVVSVIHTAGVSPSMGPADYVMRTNAVGTVNVDEEFYAVAGEGAVIVNVASMAAHMLPAEIIPTGQFPLALDDADAFMDAMMTACDIAPEEARSGLAYALSKSFVKWYSQSQAERFNARRLRIVSVSPGSIDTEMGRLEEAAGAGAMVADAAVPRWGKPEEMAELLAFCASEKAGYLTGTDILNDGGVIASMTERARAAAAS
ncbi:SDR family oxidoreductase [Mycobacterium intracellulare]|uniref:SDR family oxidoreductase n=2 Tax=Mycobacterium intracellulare TaxID=1767 RepID=UPI000931201D|nr:SDR family oxidoreductase [Mycobacterium intracellulare]ARV84743.1 oxidoreductase [Mycobacterium intracellulare subsp. chimaera]MCA2308138.1 SDR family oxidoreductase [Mycobacterium intracellulare subsp. chimaera]MCA2350968.1 SDR family oxidoreductase [Mycobacterium intracellulare subsp. chimaera]MCV7323328.1 SDR family oxidoreductase [Mycobacterium intracellulare subsp. chimaera]MDM3904871.1 SDR family oxidoreductase [Mycobacterium intracellulare subsp. chimaera]